MEICYSKSINVKYDADVFVAGAGPSGFAAAVSAARCGMKVILSEQSGVIGGSSMLSGVPELMNFDDGVNFLSKGIGREVYDRLGYSYSYNRSWHNVRPEELKLIYDDLTLSSGVKVLFYTHLTDVIKEGDKITHAVLSSPEGSFAVSAKVFIDCTGQGFLSFLAGASFLYGDEDGSTMSTTLCSVWGGVDFEKKKSEGDYEKAYREGVFSQYDPILPGIKANFPEVGVGFGNVGHCFKVKDTDTESITEAMFKGRKILSEYEIYYRNYVPGAENAVLIKSADFLGIRESRRVVCEYMLTTDTFFMKEAFPDEIGRYSYPVDIHPMSADKKGVKGFAKALSMRHENGESYSIPYRSLVVKGINNLLVAGRAIGADRGMQASVRVIPCCYITGQAAGTAASISVRDNVPAKDINIEKLKKLLEL